jgi:hypothetical protein
MEELDAQIGKGKSAKTRLQQSNCSGRNAQAAGSHYQQQPQQAVGYQHHFQQPTSQQPSKVLQQATLDTYFMDNRTTQQTSPAENINPHPQTANGQQHPSYMPHQVMRSSFQPPVSQTGTGSNSLFADSESFIYDTEDLTDEFNSMLRYNSYTGGYGGYNAMKVDIPSFPISNVPNLCTQPSILPPQIAPSAHMNLTNSPTHGQYNDPTKREGGQRRRFEVIKQAVLQGKVFVSPQYLPNYFSTPRQPRQQEAAYHTSKSDTHHIAMIQQRYASDNKEISVQQQQSIANKRQEALQRLHATRTKEQQSHLAPQPDTYANVRSRFY